MLQEMFANPGPLEHRALQIIDMDSERSASKQYNRLVVCTENFIRVDDAPESPKLAE
jgi:hypothetical protein